MKKRRIHIDEDLFPPELQGFISGCNVYDSSCSSDAKVYYCDSGYYIKEDEKGALEREASLCALFHSRGLGVEAVSYISREKDYLVTRAAVGNDLTHFLRDPVELCRALADALRLLHKENIDGIPLSYRYQRYQESAKGDLSGGWYDRSVLMDRFLIGSKEEAWEIMQANLHRLKADTLIHGDACLPNMIASGGRFETFIDVGLAGVGDKHMDIYWAIWSLEYNLKTDAYTDLLLDLYGRDDFNMDMLRVIAAFELFG